MFEGFVSPFEDEVEIGIPLPKRLTCDEIVAAYEARRNAMTQAERDAEDEAAMMAEAEACSRWDEATQAASFGLTLAEYREGRQ